MGVATVHYGGGALLTLVISGSLEWPQQLRATVDFGTLSLSSGDVGRGSAGGAPSEW